MIMLFGATGGALLFLLARRFELASRPDRWVALVLLVLIVESFVYPSQMGIPVGPFRIPVLGGGMRTHDALVVIGLAARATVRPHRGRIRVHSALWFVTGLWLLTAAMRGLVSGNNMSLLLFSTGSVVGLVGGFLLVSGCDPARLADLFRARYLIPIGLIVAVLVVNKTQAEPAVLFGTGLGSLSVDANSVFLVLGCFGVLVEWSRRPRSALAVWLCVPLLIAPLMVEQRATLFHLAATALVLVLAVVSSHWNDRIQVTRVTLLWGTTLVIGALAALLMVNLSAGNRSIPLADYYSDTFQSPRRAESAQARRESFAIGVEQWKEEPLFGQGLGHTYSVVRPGSQTTVEPGTFDNVPLDVLVRSGLVGLVLFVAANLVAIVSGWRMWKQYPDRLVAALALAATAALIGLSVKAGVESILEKGKLAILWGMTAGVVASVQRRFDRLRPVETRRDLQHRPFEGAPQWT